MSDDHTNLIHHRIYCREQKSGLRQHSYGWEMRSFSPSGDVLSASQSSSGDPIWEYTEMAWEFGAHCWAEGAVFARRLYMVHVQSRGAFHVSLDERAPTEWGDLVG